MAEIQTQRQTSIPLIRAAALNEQSFGELTGENKTALRAQLGTDAYTKMIKAWHGKAPGGESLETVHDRVIAYFKRVILKDLLKGNNILIVSHHQVLRCFVKYLEHISHEEIADVRVGNAEALIYDFDPKNEELTRQLPS